MRRHWLLFSQTVTVLLALYFVVATLQPQWLKHDSRSTAALQALPAPTAANPNALAAATALPGSFRTAAQRASQSVASINTSKTVRHPYANDPFFQYFFGESPNRAQSGLGSGVIVSSDGYLLTNNHVIEGADVITVTLQDEREFTAQVIGTDPECDLAVLKIDADNLPAIQIGNSENIAIGDAVLAIGNPFGVGQTVTSGIISALGRNHLGLNNYENFIQTDAAINPGNSGGALVDINGELVGINTAIFSQSGGSLGIGFAIPAKMAQSVMESIIRDGSVTRAWVGLVSNPLTPELAQAAGAKTTSGVIVTGVLQDGPAGLVGIRPGDVITQIDNRAIQSVSDLMTTIAGLTPNVPASFEMERHGQAQTVSVTPAVRPEPQRASPNKPIS